MERRELKIKAKNSLKKNYFMLIIVAFITTIIISGGYNFYTDIYNSETYKINEETDTKVIMNKKSNAEIADTFLKNILKLNDSEQIAQSEQNSQYTRGILAVFFNKISSSNSFIFGILSAFNTLIFGGRIANLVLMIIGAIVLCAIYIFIQNVFIVGRNRYFLESTKYTKTSFDKIFFPYNVRKSFNVAWIMFVREVYQFLWNLTIIGGFIKHYSYLMIPYILAENPSIGRKEAFELSKKLIAGNKWNAFKLDFSFIGWNILQTLTLNLSNIFFGDAYYSLTIAYLYMSLRETAKENNVQYSELLKDDTLVGELVQEEYPIEEYFLPIRKKHRVNKIDYEKDYSIKNLILFFFTFSIFGWIWEVALHLINRSRFC